jgi:hypothetical protein
VRLLRPEFLILPGRSYATAGACLVLWGDKGVNGGRVVENVPEAIGLKVAFSVNGSCALTDGLCWDWTKGSSPIGTENSIK